MTLIVPAELPTPDVVVVVPAEGRVLVFVDPRVSCATAADVVVRVKGALRRPGDRQHNLARALDAPPHVVGAA